MKDISPKSEMILRIPALCEVNVDRITRENRLAKLKEAAWSDNATFARKINARITREAKKMYQQVHEAIREEHVKFNLDKFISDDLPHAGSIVAFMAYERVRYAYEKFQLNRYPIRDLVLDQYNIKHPFVTYTKEHETHLMERGFWRNSMGWSDANGAAIRTRDWIEWSWPTKSVPLADDPAGILCVQREFDEAFEKIKAAFSPSVEAYNTAKEGGKKAFDAAKSVDDNPHAAESIAWTGWRNGFEYAKKVESCPEFLIF